MQRLDQVAHFSVSAAIILPSSTADIQVRHYAVGWRLLPVSITLMVSPPPRNNSVLTFLSRSA